MTLAQMRAEAQRRLDAAIAERATHTAGLAALRSRLGAGDNTVTEADVTAAITARAAVDATIDQDRARVGELDAEIARDAEFETQTQTRTPGAARPAYGDGVTGREARTYSRHMSDSGERSFFADFYRAEHRADYTARDRLARHMVEVEREGELTERALATGGAAGLVVPQYLIDLAAPVLRAGRPFANIVNRQQIPAQGMSFVVPRGTTGAAAAAQATENSAVQNTDQVWANLTVPVVTVAGQQQPSRQLLDRGTPGMDRIIYTDLAKAYHANLGGQTLTGAGTGGTMLGIQNTAGIGSATAFGAVPSVTNFNLKLAGQYNSVTSAGAGILARVMVMHPRRWAWLLGQVDSTGRPIVSVNNVANFNAAAINSQPGAISADSGDGLDVTTAIFVGVHNGTGLPVITDLGVPAAVGTNSEDLVFVVDNTEIYLWEDGDGMPTELRFEQTLGNQLTVTLVVAGYAAFTAGRYPLAVGKVGGLDSTATFGLVAPSF